MARVSHRRPAWLKPDVGLASRMVLTMFLLGLVYVVFVLILAQIGVPLLLLILIALVIAGVQLLFADKIALMSMGARIVSEQEEPGLHDMIGRLAAQANLPKPKIAIVDTMLPNAFATGRDQNHAVVAVTTGIKQRLEPQQLEAVLAHEMTHIINHDMLVMTIATFFSMVIAIIMRSFLWSSMFGGFGYGGGGYGRRRGNAQEDMALVLLVSAAVYAVSFLLIRALSRYRELAADRGSALITGRPLDLAAALQTISGAMQQRGIPDSDFRKAEAVNALFIVPAKRGHSLSTLISTHPSIEDRINRLEAMQAQIERQGRVS